MLRFAFVVNATSLINSYAHLYGARPYDEKIQPRDNMLITLITSGDGFHNYHHTYPYDYASSENGTFK